MTFILYLVAITLILYNITFIATLTIVQVVQKVMLSCKLQVMVLAESLLSWHDPSFDDLYGLFNQLYYKHIIIYYFHHIMFDMHTKLSRCSYAVIGHNKSPCRFSAQLHIGVVRD